MKSIWLVPLIVVTHFASASTYISAKQSPGYYRIKVGELLVTAVSDGTVDIPLDKLLTNESPELIIKELKSSYLKPETETSINAYVIDDGKQQILVDAGAGELFGNIGGHITENLAAAGYPADSIDAVLLTHIHADHSGGISKGDKLVFPNAKVYVDQRDVSFWLDRKNIKNVNPDQRHTFAESEKTVGTVIKAGQLITFQAPVKLFPGIEVIPAPGHTPGSVIYKVSSDGKNLILWGDIIHARAIQMHSPSVAIRFDINPKKAIETRERILNTVAKEGDLVAAAHISFPGFGHVIKEGKGYRWLPLEYSNHLNNKQ
ncbi:MBL fold metallo-hydrolase [Brenneria uluponensis]|uniref:MBL fold metallo-hydrolase n=1 Tax=Brenneria uluponensis TaxID=3057057 RepID=UPI0028E59994|nr:MBL fold metallo-hydrolase [Brenneria ulupoensis]